mgnify:FL=1
MNVSFLIPSRNGVEYLEWAYNSIRKNQEDHEVEILVLDDKSDKDITWDWCVGTIKGDPNFKAHQNKLPDRLGISGGHKFLSQQATQEIICHWHNDMFLGPDVLDEVEKVLYNAKFTQYGEDTGIELGNPEFKKVVCLTRVEPPIYNPGKEKIIWKQAPTNLDGWDEDEFLNQIPTFEKEWDYKATGGHFAPFFMFRSEYELLGGVDCKTFPKQSREDSDLAFRLALAGYETTQIPAFVFHFASRGNRRNKYETNEFTDNPAWTEHNVKATRNFIRKWQTFNLHDDFLKPIRPNRYNIGIVLKNPTNHLIYTLEPWCDKLDLVGEPTKVKTLKDNYIKEEQPNTTFDLTDKINSIKPSKLPDIIIEVDGNRFFQEDMFYLSNISEILTDSGEIGEMQIGNLKLNIARLTHYEMNLVTANNEKIELE